MVELREQPASNWLPPNHNDIGAIEMARKSLLERFEEKYCPEPNSGCWLWTHGTNRKGYGHFYFNGERWMAHRASWVMAHGEIPKGMHVLHRCDTPCCVRPDHLWLGSNADNVADCMTKRRHRFGSKSNLAKIDDKTALQIYNDRSSAKQIAQRHNLHISTIRRIKSKLIWKHIHD